MRIRKLSVRARGLPLRANETFWDVPPILSAKSFCVFIIDLCRKCSKTALKRFVLSIIHDVLLIILNLRLLFIADKTFCIIFAASKPEFDTQMRVKG